MPDDRPSFAEWQAISAELSEAVHQALPLELLQTVDTMVSQLATDLGENPDAWLGAVEFAYQMTCLLSAGMSFNEVDLMTNAFSMAILLFVTRFLSHPRVQPIIKAFTEADE